MVKKLTGARYFVMDADVPVVESGAGRTFSTTRKDMRYPPTHVDRVLHDGDTVRLGGAVLVAHLTAGNTKERPPGPWMKKRRQDAARGHRWQPKCESGYKLVGNKTYPRIAIDYRMVSRSQSIAVRYFSRRTCGYYGMKAKYERWKQGITMPSSIPGVRELYR